MELTVYGLEGAWQLGCPQKICLSITLRSFTQTFLRMSVNTEVKQASPQVGSCCRGRNAAAGFHRVILSVEDASEAHRPNRHLPGIPSAAAAWSVDGGPGGPGECWPIASADQEAFMGPSSMLEV